MSWSTVTRSKHRRTSSLTSIFVLFRTHLEVTVARSSCSSSTNLPPFKLLTLFSEPTGRPTVRPAALSKALHHPIRHRRARMETSRHFASKYVAFHWFCERRWPGQRAFRTFQRRIRSPLFRKRWIRIRRAPGSSLEILSASDGLVGLNFRMKKTCP